MDFHSLPRRVLQLLCKQNKIPANTTNIAMADALLSLPTVEGLDQIQPESKTPTRPPNPPRSCRKSSSLISKTSPSLNTRVKQEQRPKIAEAPNVRMSKRSRTLSSSGASSRRQRDCREDPTKMPPLGALVPCKESAVRLKTFNRRRKRRDDPPRKQEAKPDCTQGVRKNADCMKVCTTDCTLGVPQNADCMKVSATDYAQGLLHNADCMKVSVTDCAQGLLQNADSMEERTRVGGKGEAFEAELLTIEQEPAKQVEERTRSIGIQVDFTDSEIPIAHPDSGEILNNERAEASCLEHQQLASFLPESSQESLNVTSNIVNLFESQQPQSSEIKKPNVKSQESDASIGLLCVPVVEENDEGKHREPVGAHKEKENEEVISKSVEMSVEDLEMKQQIEKDTEKQTELASLSLRKLRSLCKKTKEVSKLETKEESGGEVKVRSDEKKKNAEDARLNGLSLRRLKFLYKNNVSNFQSPKSGSS